MKAILMYNANQTKFSCHDSGHDSNHDYSQGVSVISDIWYFDNGIFEPCGKYIS